MVTDRNLHFSNYRYFRQLTVNSHESNFKLQHLMLLFILYLPTNYVTPLYTFPFSASITHATPNLNFIVLFHLSFIRSWYCSVKLLTYMRSCWA